jgi:hypothetical protein
MVNPDEECNTILQNNGNNLPKNTTITSWKTKTFNLSLLYTVSQEEGTKLREGVPYVKLYRKTPKHLYPKLNGLGDNGN